MIVIYSCPFTFLVYLSSVLMDEIASKSINATFLIQKWIAIFCLVRNVHICVTSQLVSPVGELAFVSVRAQSCLSEIFAQGTFCFVFLRWSESEGVVKMFIYAIKHYFILSFGRDVRTSFVNGREVLVYLDLGCHVS